jgi:hypothetical protein
MTLSSKQIDDIGNLYENIIASGQEEQLNEDLIGDIRANAGRVVRGVQSAAGAANRAAGAVNQAMVSRITPKPTPKVEPAKPAPQLKGLNVGPGGFRINNKPVNPGMSPIFQRPGAQPPTRPARSATPAPVARPAAPPTATKPSAPAAAKPTPSAPTAPSSATRGFQLSRQGVDLSKSSAPAATASVKKPSLAAQAVELRAMQAASRQRQGLTQSFDIFDVIKGHLLDEGYADTEEAALAIMANMSEEWKLSIVEQSNTLVTPEQRRADELKHGMKRTTQVPPSKPGGTKTKPGSRMPL